MGDLNTLFFELIRVAIGTQETLSRFPSETEWEELFDMAVKQSLVGVCFMGLHRIGADSDEGYSRIGMSEKLFFDWMGMAAQINMKNDLVNEQCVELQKRISADGLRSCVLKGQGVASLYGEELQGFRQSGDIDIWVEGGFEKVNEWAQQIAPCKAINQHHIQLDVFDDTEVELHYYPFNLTSPIKNKTLKAFFSEHENECLENINAGGINVPTTEFNIIFLLVHIFHHLFTEGVGLRQLMDYYYVLCTVTGSKIQVKEVQSVIHDLGLERFASALMWVMVYVFGLEEKQAIWALNETDGTFLLNEVMMSGNFGKQDQRQKGLYDNKWNSFWIVHGKTIRFWRFDKWAWFWSPVSRVSGFLWRKRNGYK